MILQVNLPPGMLHQGWAFFGGFDNPPQVFRTYNPSLQSAFAVFWNRLYASPGLLGALLRLAVRLL